MFRTAAGALAPAAAQRARPIPPPARRAAWCLQGPCSSALGIDALADVALSVL